VGVFDRNVFSRVFLLFLIEMCLVEYFYVYCLGSSGGVFYLEFDWLSFFEV